MSAGWTRPWTDIAGTAVMRLSRMTLRAKIDEADHSGRWSELPSLIYRCNIGEMAHNSLGQMLHCRLLPSAEGDPRRTRRTEADGTR